MKECQLCKNCYTDDVNTCPKDGMPTYHSISGEPVLEGKYHLECRLGQGGMGVVYKSRHAYLKTSHAIKVILPDLVGNDPQLVTRFRQEALAAAAIRHQNVVGVSDYGVSQGTMPFLVMEFVEGESLHDLLDREKKLSPEKAFDLMSAICAGVGAAHNQGIVHRDLKPLNIMICKDKSNMSEAVKILDFGLAKIKSGELLGSFIQAQTTGLMGSPYYMAPEQWADEEPDAKSDVYSLGVMLYQMIAGDVPFKGSSIPAIMKKHLSDEVPPLNTFDVSVSPQIELAIRHTLAKEPGKRTATVEQIVEELRTALGITSQIPGTVGSITNRSLPVSTLSILTNPPQAKIFVDNVAVGQSQTNGWLLLEGLQSGNHQLRVSSEGFQDWESNMIFDGKPKQVVAELKAEFKPDTGAIPKPSFQTVPGILPPVKQATPKQTTPPQSFSATQGSQTANNQTAKQTVQASQQSRFVESSLLQSVPVKSQSKKTSFFSPLILTIIGICSLLLLAIIGTGSAFMLGIIGRPSGNTNVANKNIVTVPNSTSSGQNNASNVQTASPNKSEMVKIQGGKFTMGRNDGGTLERPEHQVEVKSFWMDKTEVTTAEYYDFVKESGYMSTPANWEGGKPLARDEKLPVRFVNIDDIKAFVEWRSARDKVAYRLPTEEEWEYAARNGNANNLYPWGDSFKEGCAVVDRTDTAPEPVGSKSCGANKWGVLDLIGNVYEWTNSKATLYPGSVAAELKEPLKDNIYIFRGGSAFNKSTGDKAITSTYRGTINMTKRDAQLGFRLVRSE
ncbi:MAG: SUMF1/EgtB/PvdO family nonheme iron enzyme [Acidobacteria bacterium]|nr:SUMF1/EgtB/PvdO family nonheme iron enzyme [Acidobacteriota bacterium]